MAELDVPELMFDRQGCPDCGLRRVRLPDAMPRVGDDFDWHTRDFEGFRIHMLEDLAARFPERNRWTRADLEVVLVEMLAAVLDQLSDMSDRVFAESYLETARNPAQVLELLQMFGYDPSAAPGGTASLLESWAETPFLMETARREAARRIAEQQRMVTLADFDVELAKHPLVERASAQLSWTGSYWTVVAAVALYADHELDEPLDRLFRADPDLRQRVELFHSSRRVRLADSRATPRAMLESYVRAYRMLGQPVELHGVIPVGLDIRVCLRIDSDYFQSELRDAVAAALGRGPGQFFEPGNLQFGQAIYVSDIVQSLMALEGVEDVVVKHLSRIQVRDEREAERGVLKLHGLEIARCDNDPRHPEFGQLRIEVHGGRNG